MLTYEEARKIVAEHLSTLPAIPDDEFIILDKGTIEEPYAWIFFWTSRRWNEGDADYAVGGNGPIFIDKKTGKRKSYSTGLGIDNMINAHEESEKIWELVIKNGAAIDDHKGVLLKHELNFTFEEILQMRKESMPRIAAGSQARLEQLQQELLESGMETELVFAWAQR